MHRHTNVTEHYINGTVMSHQTRSLQYLVYTVSTSKIVGIGYSVSG